MSGLYNLVLGDGGEHIRGAAVCDVLGLTTAAVGRFRDAWVEQRDGMPVIAIYTRNGGGNREHYADDVDAGPDCTCTGCIITYRLPAHPLYLNDRDDGFDPTYATVYFNVPEAFRAELSEVMIDPVDTDARWRAAIDAIGKSADGG